MTSIVDEVIGKPQPRAELFDEYRELLRPGREHAAGDVGRLKQLMRALDISGEQMRAHAQALADVAELEASLAGEAEAKAKAEQAGRAWREHEEETKRIVQQREREEGELRVNAMGLREKAEAFTRTRQNIGKLRRQHRELFGEQEPEAAPEPHHIGQEVARHPDPPPPITTPATFA